MSSTTLSAPPNFSLQVLISLLSPVIVVFYKTLWMQLFHSHSTAESLLSLTSHGELLPVDVSILVLLV